MVTAALQVVAPVALLPESDGEEGIFLLDYLPSAADVDSQRLTRTAVSTGLSYLR